MRWDVAGVVAESAFVTAVSERGRESLRTLAGPDWAHKVHLVPCGVTRPLEFRLGEIEHLPVADASVDVVISNCVINLSPDKRAVWREIARVLRPGGRVAVSDLALIKPLSPGVREDVEALIGCVAGADLVDGVRAAAEAAGLTGVRLVAKPEYVDAMTAWQDPLYRKIAASLPAGARMSDYVVSLDVSAVRG